MVVSRACRSARRSSCRRATDKNATASAAAPPPAANALPAVHRGASQCRASCSSRVEHRPSSCESRATASASCSSPTRRAACDRDDAPPVGARARDVSGVSTIGPSAGATRGAIAGAEAAIAATGRCSCQIKRPGRGGRNRRGRAPVASAARSAVVPVTSASRGPACGDARAAHMAGGSEARGRRAKPP